MSYFTSKFAPQFIMAELNNKHNTYVIITFMLFLKCVYHNFAYRTRNFHYNQLIFHILSLRLSMRFLRDLFINSSKILLAIMSHCYISSEIFRTVFLQDKQFVCACFPFAGKRLRSRLLGTCPTTRFALRHTELRARKAEKGTLESASKSGMRANANCKVLTNVS